MKKKFVPVVFLAQKAKEKDIKKAVNEIDKLTVTSGKTAIIRMEKQKPL